MERVFDICHGCRRCVSLCQSFPTLFDLIDATADGEVHGVAQEDYAKVVDQCYLCDLCYMTKCPYVPPHPWNVDFPHLMLRAKAIKFGKGERRRGERLLASTDVHGQLAGIPIVVQAVNAANRTRPVRKLLDAALGVHPDAWLPPLATQRFAAGAATSAPVPGARRRAHARARSRSSRPATSTTTSPGIGHDLLAVLAHNEIPYEIVEKESCCGMPKLELGDLEGVAEAEAERTSRCSRATRARAGRSSRRSRRAR